MADAARRVSDAGLAALIVLVILAYSLTRQVFASQVGSIFGSLAAAAVAFLVAWAVVRHVRSAV